MLGRSYVNARQAIGWGGRALRSQGVASQNSESPANRRSGFTVLELLTVVAVIGILLSLALPAISSAREAARRVTCVNRLKQIGLAMHNYHDVYQRLPSGWQWEATGQSAYGWAVPLLPYLEQNEVYRRIDRNLLLNAPANSFGVNASLDELLCPSDIYERRFTLYHDDDDDDDEGEAAAYQSPDIPLLDLPTASYVAVFGTLEPDDGPPEPIGDGAFPGAESVRLADFTRGLSNTLYVGERTMARVPSTWLGIDYRGDDATCRLVGSAMTAPNCDTCDECEFDSRHAGGANFLWGDGRVQFVSENIDSDTYRSNSRRQVFSSWITAGRFGN